MKTRTAAAAVLALALASMSACSAPSAAAWTQISDAYAGNDFAHRDVPFDQLLEDADVTVVAAFGEVIGERALAEDYVYVQIELVVREVIDGDVAVGDVLTFEGWGTEATAVPPGEMLLFLIEKESAVDPPGLWIWHTSRGIWAETDRAAIDTPIADEPPGDNPLYASDISGANSLADVVDVVEDIAGRR